jgi:hypothetical protein
MHTGRASAHFSSYSYVAKSVYYKDVCSGPFSGILGIFAKLQKVTNIHHVCLSICLSAQKNSTPLKEFSRNLVFEYFSKICHGS